MKKTLLTIFASSLVLMACAQKPTPPKEVQSAFSKKFATVEDLKWEQEDAEWEAEFKNNGVKMSVSFDTAGKWIETESKVKKEDLPAPIFKSIALKFNGFEIEEIEKIESANFNGYAIELEKGETEVEILATAEGVITIKKVKVEEDDKEEHHNDKDDEDNEDED